MTATAAQIAEVRRMVNEPTETTYDDDAITTFIERYPLLDERGEEPYTWDTSTSPPTQDENDDWVDTYDVHAAAADIWQEKAAVVADDFAFSADGGNYSRDQVFAQRMRLAAWHRARRALSTHKALLYPKPDAQPQSWIGNLAEVD